MNDQFYYPHLPNNLVLDLLQTAEFAESLANLADNKPHKNLRVLPKPCSIEISNAEINISIVLYSGFELNEWLILKSHPNLQLICLSQIITQMYEFEGLDIKFIDKLAWFFHVINHSENELVKKLKQLKNIAIS